MKKKVISNKNKIVKTYNGNRRKRGNCKRIQGQYYEVGDITIKDSGECYLVAGKYHRFNNGKIEYDYEIKRYVLRHKTHLKHGVVDIKNNKPIMGYFSSNLTKNITLVKEDGIALHCISEEVAIKLGYREKFSNGYFYDKKSENVNFFKKIGKPPINKNDLPYDSRFASDITTTQYDSNYNPEFNNKNLNKVGDFLEKNGITFGVEFETTTGYIPDRLCYKYGLIPLRDGSIQGLEYVTIPLSGKKGLYALKEICYELNKRTRYDLNCALHIHLGGLERSTEKILSSYILAHLIQDNMFNLQPSYKRGGMGVKSKDYCKPLDNELFNSLIKPVNSTNIDSNFEKVFSFVSDKRKFSGYNNDLNKVLSHPSDPEGTRKWQIKSRYRWINFVPIIFGNKKTIEFRHHNATFDFNKIINFLFNCAVFIKVSNDYSSDVLNSNSDLYKSLTKEPFTALKTLNDFLISKTHAHLTSICKINNEYNAKRAEIMAEMTDKGDIIGKTETRYNKEFDALNDNGKFWQ